MKTRRTTRHRMLTGALLSGGTAGVLLLAPSIAGAANPTGASFDRTTPPTTEPASADAGGSGDLTTVEPGDHLRELLQTLVDDGTITAEQLDAIVESVRSMVPHIVMQGGPMLVPPNVGRGHGGPFDRGGIEVHVGPMGDPGMDREVWPGRHGGLFGDSYALDLMANTIGITAPDLLDQLDDGATVAEIATDAGTDPQAVIDALVADAETRLDAAVQSGRITQAVADEQLETATEQITNVVNGGAAATAAETGTSDSEDGATATTETTTG